MSIIYMLASYVAGFNDKMISNMTEQDIFRKPIFTGIERTKSQMVVPALFTVNLKYYDVYSVLYTW